MKYDELRAEGLDSFEASRKAYEAASNLKFTRAGTIKKKK